MSFLKHFVRRLGSLALRAPRLGPEEIRRVWRETPTVCVLAAGGIGDAVMATPLVAEIASRRPGVRIVVVGKEVTAQVFRSNPAVSAVFAYGGGAAGFLAAIRRVRAERPGVFLGAQPSNTIRHSLVAGLSGVPVRLKHERDYSANPEGDFSFVYTALLPTRLERHRVEENLDLLRHLGEQIPEGERRPAFVYRAEAAGRVERWLAERGMAAGRERLAAIHPGGARGEKQWKEERFAEVGRALADRGLRICVVGGAGEEARACERIVGMIGGDRAVSAAGIFSLEETAALLAGAGLLISNDTGIMHLATAVGTRVVAVFGPTDPRHIGPFAPDAVVVRRSSDVNDVRVEDVLAEV